MDHRAAGCEGGVPDSWCPGISAGTIHPSPPSPPAFLPHPEPSPASDPSRGECEHAVRMTHTLSFAPPCTLDTYFIQNHRPRGYAFHTYDTYHTLIIISGIAMNISTWKTPTAFNPYSINPSSRSLPGSHPPSSRLHLFTCVRSMAPNVVDPPEPATNALRPQLSYGSFKREGERERERERDTQRDTERERGRGRQPRPCC